METKPALGDPGYSEFVIREMYKREHAAEAATKQAAAERAYQYELKRERPPEMPHLIGEIYDQLVAVGAKPHRPADCWIKTGEWHLHDADPNYIAFALGRIQLLANWHAADRPKDVRAWFLRVWGALVMVPGHMLPTSGPEIERLTPVWTRYACPNPPPEAR